MTCHRFSRNFLYPSLALAQHRLGHSSYLTSSSTTLHLRSLTLYLAPSGRVNNHWHFDLRYVYLEPPAHLVFIVQPESSFIHSERLPSNSSKDDGIAFFPESARDAAPEVCKALIYSFLDGFGAHCFGQPMVPYGPWSLSTEDRALVDAVGKEFKRLGVRSEFHEIKVLTQDQSHSDKAFFNFWNRLSAQVSALTWRAKHGSV